MFLPLSIFRVTNYSRITRRKSAHRRYSSKYYLSDFVNIRKNLSEIHRKHQIYSAYYLILSGFNFQPRMLNSRPRETQEFQFTYYIRLAQDEAAGGRGESA